MAHGRLTKMEPKCMKKGSRVEVLSGEHAGKQGVIVTVPRKHCLVAIDGKPVSVPAEQLKVLD